jgi:hypothetical protein
MAEDVVYFPPGSVPPLKVSRWHSVYDVVWVKTERGWRPYAFHLKRTRRGTILYARPLDAYSRDVAEYVKREYEKCWAAKLSGEAFHWFLRVYGMHPGAWCMKQIMYGKKFKAHKKKTDWLIEALLSKYGEMFGAKNL